MSTRAACDSNWKLFLSYDGNQYLGWQKTKVGPSIEETLQATLEQILQHPIILQAASRTDAGVHAIHQVVNFHTSNETIQSGLLIHALNSLLPKDIRVIGAELANPSFHPTLDCTAKEYHYWICHGQAQMPQHRLYSWHYPQDLDKQAMEAAAQFVIGKHDFSAFCNVRKNAAYQHYERHIHSIKLISLEQNRLRVEVTGNHFLYKMVRNLVGTLAYVGSGRIAVNDMPEILESKDRKRAGVTAPAHGLFLYKVLYAGH